MSDWFIRRGEEQLGPLTQLEFDELQKRGHIRDDDWVWFRNWANWQRFNDMRRESTVTPPPFLPSDDVILGIPEGFKELQPKEVLAHLVGEHLKSIGIDQKERRRSQYAELLLDLLRDVGKLDGIPWTEDRLQDAVKRAGRLIERFRYASQRNDDRGEPLPDEPELYRTIWRHRDLGQVFRDGFASKEACPMDREGISAVADEYLRQELRSPKLEVLLLDALVAREVYAYGEELKQNPSRYVKRFTFDQIARTMGELEAYDDAKGDFDKLVWIWMKRNLKIALIRAAFLYGVPIGVAWIAAENNQGGVAFAAGAFVAVLVAYRLLSWVWRKLRSLFQMPAKEPLEKAFELHGKMVLAYNELKGGTSSSPQRAREVLAKVADEGAAWDPGVFSILDAAIARSRGNWG